MPELAVGYAEVEDVLARAGVLATAWDDSTTPGRSEIESFIRSTAAEIDAGVASHGYSTPVVDVVAAPALAGYNADKALLLTIDATWPGTSARDDVASMRAAIQARVDAADKLMAAGDLAAVLVLAGSAAAAQQGGAANFWDEDGTTYSWWLDRLQNWNVPGDPWGVQGPEFYRGMRL